MAGPYQSMGDSELFAGLPLPASPITASGEDPDELREKMAAAAGGQGTGGAWRGVPWALTQASGANMNPGQPAAPPPAAASPSALPPPARPENFEPAGFNADAARQAMTGQLAAGQRLSAIGGQMQVDPQIQALEDQKLKDESAAPDPTKYKPGFGTRLLRGLKGAGLGLAEHGIFGAGVGALAPQLVPGGTAYSAPTDAYDVALNKNKQMVAGDAERLQSARDAFTLAQSTRVAQQKAVQESGETFKGAGSTATSQEGEENTAAQLPIDQQKAFNASPEGKLQITQNEVDLRTQKADQLKLPPGMTRTRYILTGEMQPSREATAEEIAVNRVAQAWRNDHGGQAPKTVADWQGIYAAAKGSTGASGSNAEAQNLREAATLAAQQVKTLTSLMSSKGGVLWDDTEKKQHQDELDAATAKANELQQKLLAASQTAQPAPAAAPAAAGAAAPAPAGQPGGDGQFSSDGKKVMHGGQWVNATGADGMVRMKVPDVNNPGKTRIARLAPEKVAQASALGAQFAGGQ